MKAAFGYPLYCSRTATHLYAMGLVLDRDDQFILAMRLGWFADHGVGIGAALDWEE